MARYTVEYGALQADAKRLIETELSACEPVKISDNFAKRIAFALNQCEPDARRYIPSARDLDQLDAVADRMINSDQYGGGILKAMVADYRGLRREADAYVNAERDVNGNPVAEERQ